MARKRRTKPSAIKTVFCAVFVMLTAYLGIWCSLSGEASVSMMMTFCGMVVLILVFWFLGEHFRFSFGKPRYLTRAERKRLRHQRKNKAGDKIILGRRIPEQNDR